MQRGNITLWISEEAIEGWKPASSGTRGGQKKFSDHAIETALLLRLVFKLRRWCTNRREDSPTPPISAVLSAQSATFSA
jgi:hypothetical protein